MANGGIGHDRLAMAWLKFLHICAISVWCAGLISLPFLHVCRHRVSGAFDTKNLQAMSRFLFGAIVSPAAFIAIGTGVVLIFWRETFEPWFSLKLAFVGLLVIIHMFVGRTTRKLFDKGGRYTKWQRWLVLSWTTAAIGGVLFFVLAKPRITLKPPRALGEAGALRDLLMPLWPFGI